VWRFSYPFPLRSRSNSATPTVAIIRVVTPYPTPSTRKASMKRSIGIDLGVTSKSRIAVAEGNTILSNKAVRSTPRELTHAIKAASEGESVELILESTGMSWFLTAVAAERSGVDYTLYRVNGRKAAALRRFYKEHTKTDRIDAPVLARMPLVDGDLHAFTLPSGSELGLKRLVTYRHRLEREARRTTSRMRSLLHWAAPGLLRPTKGTSPALLRILTAWPDLRTLARAHVGTITKRSGLATSKRGTGAQHRAGSRNLLR